MNQTLLLKRIEVYLRERMGFDKYETTGIIVATVRAAKVRGYDLDVRFAEAGLTAGTGTRDLSLLILYALAGTSPTDHVLGLPLLHWAVSMLGLGPSRLGFRSAYPR